MFVEQSRYWVFVDKFQFVTDSAGILVSSPVITDNNGLRIIYVHLIEVFC